MKQLIVNLYTDVSCRPPKDFCETGDPLSGIAKVPPEEIVIFFVGSLKANGFCTGKSGLSGDSGGMVKVLLYIDADVSEYTDAVFGSVNTVDVVRSEHALISSE